MRSFRLTTTAPAHRAAVAIGAALFGGVDGETPKAFAVFGAMMFAATWAGFLVAGNWFCYWFSHGGAQMTHFQMNLWGLATLVLLAAAWRRPGRRSAE